MACTNCGCAICDCEITLPIGSAGQNGTNGQDGVVVLHGGDPKETSDVLTIGAIYTFPNSYTMPAATLVNDGDHIIIKAAFEEVVTNSGGQCRINLNGTPFVTSPQFYYDPYLEQIVIELTIMRIGTPPGNTVRYGHRSHLIILPNNQIDQTIEWGEQGGLNSSFNLDNDNITITAQVTGGQTNGQVDLLDLHVIKYKK